MVALQLLAVGSQPGTMVTAVTCTGHIVTSLSHQTCEVDKEREPRGPSHSQRWGSFDYMDLCWQSDVSASSYAV